MNSRTTQEFREQLAHLPEAVRRQARRAFELWRADPSHASLYFKRVSERQPIYSVRVGLGHRALGLDEGGTVYWFWIGSHAEYDQLLRRL